VDWQTVSGMVSQSLDMCQANFRLAAATAIEQPGNVLSALIQGLGRTAFGSAHEKNLGWETYVIGGGVLMK
jgi:hypothetical protein